VKIKTNGDATPEQLFKILKDLLTTHLQQFYLEVQGEEGEPLFHSHDPYNKDKE
jgi:hypothetical protein